MKIWTLGAVLLLAATVSAQIFQQRPAVSAFRPVNNNAGRYKPDTNRYRPSNEGRYRGNDDGKYRPADDGKYRPDGSGGYSGGGGQYTGGGGQYTGSGDAGGAGGRYTGGGGQYTGGGGQYTGGGGQYTGGGGQYTGSGDAGGAYKGSGGASGSQSGAGSGSRFGSGVGSQSGAGSGSRFGSGVGSQSGAGTGSKFGSGAGSQFGSGSGSKFGSGSGSAFGADAGGLSSLGVPQGLQQGSAAGKYDNRNYAILKKVEQVEEDGYHYIYETENGIQAEEQGKLANRGTDEEAMKAKGFFSYTGPDSIIYTVTYTSDENGFLPQGAHIPTPPPIPAAILRSLEWKKSIGELE